MGCSLLFQVPEGIVSLKTLFLLNAIVTFYASVNLPNYVVSLEVVLARKSISKMNKIIQCVVLGAILNTIHLKVCMIIARC